MQLSPLTHTFHKHLEAGIVSRHDNGMHAVRL